MKTLLLALSLTFFGASAVNAAEIKNPPDGSAHKTLIDGLKEIRDSKWDDWFKRCSTNKLCFNENSRKSIKTYNLPAMQRRAKNCIKAGDAIQVTRTDGDPAKDNEVKVFIQCETTAMPVPFSLIKEDGKWFFSKI